MLAAATRTCAVTSGGDVGLSTPSATLPTPTFRSIAPCVPKNVQGSPVSALIATIVASAVGAERRRGHAATRQERRRRAARAGARTGRVGRGAAGRGRVVVGHAATDHVLVRLGLAVDVRIETP